MSFPVRTAGMYTRISRESPKPKGYIQYKGHYVGAQQTLTPKQPLKAKFGVVARGVSRRITTSYHFLSLIACMRRVVSMYLSCSSSGAGHGNLVHEAGTHISRSMRSLFLSQIPASLDTAHTAHSLELQLKDGTRCHLRSALPM